MKTLKRFLPEFKNRKIITLGDICLDIYTLGTMYKISAEGPIPVIEFDEKELKSYQPGEIGVIYAPGAGGNAACNVAALGATVYPTGIIGNDRYGNIIKKEFKKVGANVSGLISSKKRRTHAYNKITCINNHTQPQQVFRIDTKRVREKLDKNLESRIKRILEENVKVCDAIMVADYSKGAVTKDLLEYVVMLGVKYNKLTVGDSRENISEYKGFKLLSINDWEAVSAVRKMGKEETITREEIEEAGNKLIDSLGANYVIVTRGKDGMSIFEKGKKSVDIPTFAKQVFDVTGAGDTVKATLTLALTSGASIVEAAKLANCAAGIVISKFGTATATAKEVEEELDKFI